MSIEKQKTPRELAEDLVKEFDVDKNILWKTTGGKIINVFNHVTDE